MKISGILYNNNIAVEISIENGLIKEIEPLEKVNEHDELPIVSPGFIDVQINGYAGKSFTEEGLTVEDVKRATQGLWKEGVTTYLPTIITSSRERIIKNLQTLKKSLDDKSISNSVPGFFVEGPYISPIDGFRGAHNASFVRLPDWDEFETFINASGKNIIKVTVAPELDGAMEFIAKCKQNNIMVAIGHHNGNADQIHLAALKGARISTHLGNGCANMIHRHN
ncbi:MAG: amidohydrolase family protein, partial [Cyclobacteriaceae bacterium]|nr:amidohydrolase family protein [Cyclobacteriaceae bacterium]